MIEVDIYEAGKHFLKGRPVQESKPFTPSIAAPLQKGQVSGLMQVNRQTHAHLKTDTDTDTNEQINKYDVYMYTDMYTIHIYSSAHQSYIKIYATSQTDSVDD